MTVMKNKIIMSLASFTALCIIYNYINFKYAYIIKEPMYRTYISKSLFIKIGGHYITSISSEVNSDDTEQKNINLDTIDMNSFHKMGSDNNNVDVRYSDNNYLYTIHDGEEKYILREKLR